MISRNISLAAAAAALVCLQAVGCKDKPETVPSASTGAPSAAASAKTTSAATPASSELPVDQFLSKLPPTACKTLEGCKNDKLKVVVTMPAMLIAGFGTLDKPELQKELEPVNAGMKSSKRFLPNESECTTLGGVALKVLGMEAKSIEAKIGKTVKYDAKKAAACIDELGKAPPACGTAVKLEAEPKMKDMEAMSKELKGDVEAYAKPCEEVFEGTVEAGGACELDVECKGKDVKCKGPKGEAKSCKAKG
jgi:hypothetical protein